ncbi:MAG: hypothetical protein U1E53_04535 [Dongiaceae bacterium]
MPPGAGYPAHVDGHDVAILLFAGTIATAGRRFGPRATLYHPAGHAHGLRNPATRSPRYLVFEFHGAHARHARTKTSLPEQADLISPRANASFDRKIIRRP